MDKHVYFLLFMHTLIFLFPDKGYAFTYGTFTFACTLIYILLRYFSFVFATCICGFVGLKFTLELILSISNIGEQIN